MRKVDNKAVAIKQISTAAFTCPEDLQSSIETIEKLDVCTLVHRCVN